MGLETSRPLPNERDDVQLFLLEVNLFRGTTFSSTGVNMNIEIFVNKDRD